jgi:citrate lyase subunit gamma (acyl carrier protein)
MRTAIAAFCLMLYRLFMEILRRESAGTLQSNDCLVEVRPAPSLTVTIESPVFLQFGKRIEEVAREIAGALFVENASICIFDRGALDCTIRARVRTALLRAAETKP